MDENRRRKVAWGAICFLPFAFVVALVLMGCFSDWNPPIDDGRFRIVVLMFACFAYLLRLFWHRCQQGRARVVIGFESRIVNSQNYFSGKSSGG